MMGFRNYNLLAKPRQHKQGDLQGGCEGFLANNLRKTKVRKLDMQLLVCE